MLWPDREPWIEPDAESPEKIAGTIKMCPSGALSYTRDGVLYKDQEREPSILVSKDGPYYVVGGPALEAPGDSKPESKEHYTLCRCGGGPKTNHSVMGSTGILTLRVTKISAWNCTRGSSMPETLFIRLTQ